MSKQDKIAKPDVTKPARADETRGRTVMPAVPTTTDHQNPVGAGRTVSPRVPTPTNKKK